MVGVTQILCGLSDAGDAYRYTPKATGEKFGIKEGHGPVVVWNCTNTCNLRCRHCYADSKPIQFDEELNTKEAKALIDDLAGLKVPVLLVSGGEPLLRKDLFELINYAAVKGIRTTLSTNGTLIDQETAKAIKAGGVGYVGISIDGMREKNDVFRGAQGSFDKAAAGIRNCLSIGQKVGLRFTISRSNYSEINSVFEFIKEEGIPRVCFYHLAYSGRGSCMADEDITLEEKRQVMDLIIKEAAKLKGKTEILTVDNHADAAYLYLQIKKNYPDQAERALRFLSMNGGNRSGMAIANIDFKGDVHPDQFSQQHHLGSIRERKFSEIWKDPEEPLLSKLRDRKPLLRGRCSDCSWLRICNGNLRVRAEAVSGDFWASDPACYLTDEEIKEGKNDCFVEYH